MIPAHAGRRSRRSAADRTVTFLAFLAFRVGEEIGGHGGAVVDLRDVRGRDSPFDAGR